VIVGKADASSVDWSSSASVSCTTQARLYCFGIDRHVTVAPPSPMNVRRAFVTHEDLAASGGAANQDAECQTEAADAGLSGLFLAAAARAPATIASRFGSGGPWARADGVIVLTPDFAATPAAVTFDATGVRQDSTAAMYGATSWMAATTSGATCQDWTSTSGNVLVGIPTRSGPLAYGGLAMTCSFGYRVYCLEH